MSVVMLRMKNKYSFFSKRAAIKMTCIRAIIPITKNCRLSGNMLQSYKLK